MTKTFIRAATVAAAMSLGVTANARAATINLAANSTTSFDILWTLAIPDPAVTLTALGEFTAVVTNSWIDFTIVMHNQTSAVSEQIHSFGFNINPDGTSVTNIVAGTNFANVGREQNLPSIDNNIDVCIWASNNCSGGAQGPNLDGGDSDTISFRLNGPFTNGATLTTFGIKFQGEEQSYEFEGNIPPNGENPPPNGPPTGVPEPASMLLVGLGMASVLAGRRRN
jgi:hypothetical protein